MKSLSQLIQRIQVVTEQKRDDYKGVQLADLQLDSRQLKRGDVFIALQGLNGHGLDYLQQALTAQVACVLADRALTQNEQACLDSHGTANAEPAVLVVDGLSKQLAALASWFYDQPGKKLKVVGITGTNGKTSTAHYLAQLLLLLGQQPALIGTLGNGLMTDLNNIKLATALNTTPDVVSVFRLLNQFYQQGANWVVMEVSSHALELGRIEQLEFEVVALTQVTRDHLDFHGTERVYQQAKTKLFTDYKSQHQVVNISDSVGRTLAEQANLQQPFLYSVQSEARAQLQCLESELSAAGIGLYLTYKSLDEQMHQAEPPPQSAIRTHLNLMGAFNIENILCAMSVLLASGFGWSKVSSLLSRLIAVDGRMEVVLKQSGLPTVIVDFAHTPDALQQVLNALKLHVTAPLKTPAKIWVVFGCGGDRDRGKRPLMAEVTERYADSVVVTSDNPRFEQPEKIITDILKGFKHPERVEMVEDRQQAIEFAVSQAKPEDVVLIAGKGHENYQDIAGVKHPFSDQQIVLDLAKKVAVE